MATISWLEKISVLLKDTEGRSVRMLGLCGLKRQECGNCGLIDDLEPDIHKMIDNMEAVRPVFDKFKQLAEDGNG